MDYEKVLSFIARCEDKAELKALMLNAADQDASEVKEAAFRRLIAISPAEEPGSLEHDLWQTVFAFEHLLKEERGKTVMLSRTRQKLGRVGVEKTLTDWAEGTKTTEGFDMLMERGMPELTGEAIVLRHPARFARRTVDAARERLSGHSADEDLLWPVGREYGCAGEPA